MHEAAQLTGAHIRDAYGDIISGWPRAGGLWPVYTTCKCGETITKTSRNTHWAHTAH